MKKLILVFAVALSLQVQAQTEKGGFTVNGGIGLQTGESSSRFSLNPSFGYFVANNFLLGGALNAEFTKLGEVKTNTFGIGPFARYYIGQATTRPFVVTEVDFLTSTTKDDNTDIKATGTRFLIGLGFAAFVNENVAVEGVSGYTYSKFQDVDGSGGFTLRLGFGLYFNRRSIRDLKTNVMGAPDN